MSERSFDLSNLTTSGALAKASAVRSTQDVVFIDVGARKIESKVVRDGVPIGVHTVNQDVLKDIIIDRPVVAFRIISQSVPAGTPVPEGTTIEVTMARPGRLPVGVISGVHLDLVRSNVEDVFTPLVTPATRRIVARAAEGALSAADEQTIKDVFANVAPVTDEPGKDVGAALETLRMLTTFGGA
ncbi:hypothetical protein [Jannaschia sp. R86511]|uniref:hypothetical protein n=1 Tax=Jannaschia sp. R86511 TaxID=3093853 RepID=UPI0036D3A670